MKNRTRLCYGILFGSIGLIIPMVIMAQAPAEMVFQNIDVWPEERAPNSFVNVIEDSYGFLWFTSSLGLHRYDGREVKTYLNQADSTSISDNYTELLFEDSRGDLWIGTAKGGINKYIRAKDHFLRITHPHITIGHSCGMTEDPQGQLWIAAGNGLFRLNPDTYELHNFIPDQTSHGPAGYSFRAITWDRYQDGHLWVAGLDCAYHVQTKSGRFEALPPNLGQHGYYMMMDWHQTGQNTLWGGSWFGGLIRYDIQNKAWHRYLPANVKEEDEASMVKSILPYKNGFWVAMRGSFGYFDSIQHQYQLLHLDPTGEHGLKKSFNYHGILITKNNNLVVARGKGFSISTPLTGLPDIPAFAPIILHAEVDHKPFASDTQYYLTRNFRMDDVEKDISFVFHLPGYYGDKPVSYAYRMEGYDLDWNAANGGREARYTNLPHGRYIFRYRASFGDDQWIEGVPLLVKKEVAIYRHPAFIASGLLLVAGVGLLFYFYRIRQARHEAKMQAEFQRKLTEVEMAALRTQMNPHFMFNSLNSIKYYILNEETDNANKYLTKFSKLMRLVLKNSQSKLVNLSEELEALNLYIELESLRFKEDFQYHIHVDEKIDQEDTYIPPLIIQPYVENAIWHGLLQKNAPGKLGIRIERKDGFVQVVVTDDGIGRDAAEAIRSKSATKKSFGTKITRDRIALVREIIGIDASVKTYDLQLEDGSPGGTRVVIRIPHITGAKVDQLNLS